MRAFVLAAAILAACSQSHAPECMPRPIGYDCMGTAPSTDGGCTTSYSCIATLRADGGRATCNTGTACTVDTDCPCVQQACVAGICWYPAR